MSNNDVETTDVVIVGAGLAGLVAGRDLSRAGLKATIVEARDRLGGRAFYRDSPLGMKLEFGGGFVHWIQPHLWAEMNAYGLKLKPVSKIAHAYWLNHGKVERMGILDFVERIAPGEAAIAEGALEAFPNPHQPFPLTPAATAADGVSVADKIASLHLEDEVADMIRAHWALSFNGPPAEGAWSQVLRLVALAAGSWEMRGQAESRYLIDGGTARLVDAIAADSSATTLLSSRIASIRHDAEGIEAATDDGRRLKAKYAIVTTPLPVLNTISFEPPLSAVKRAASAQGQVSRGIKVWMRAKGRIEPFIAFAPEQYPLTMMGYEYDIDGDTILLAFGPRATELDGNDLAAVQAAARQWLPDIELVGVDAHDWTNDPLCGETWAMLRTGQLSSQMEEFSRPEGRVIVTGSDYALGWAGHFDGAIETGRRAARNIIDVLESNPHLFNRLGDNRALRPASA